MIAIPSLSLAQQSSSSSAPAESDVIREDREFRLRGFVESIEEGTVQETQFREQSAAYFAKRAQHRRICRDDLRKANKMTLMSTLLRCYRSELSSLKDFAQKQEEIFADISGLIPTIRSQAVKSAKELSDALTTVIFAIDSGVYETKDDVLEAKRNLYRKYQLPLWSNWTMVRADRTLTWIAHLIEKIDRLTEAEKERGLDRSELSDARSCLTAQEIALRPLIQAAAENRGEKLAASLLALQECVKIVQGIPRVLTESGSLLLPQ